MDGLISLRIVGASLVAFASIHPCVAKDASGSCNRGAFVVVIDAGHTPKRPGATSSRGISEHEFNDRLAQSVSSGLRKAGFTHVVRTDDGDDISLEERSDFANRHNADLFLSLHHDSVQPQYLAEWSYEGKPRLYSDRFTGYSIFFSALNRESAESLRFARLLGQGLRQSCFHPSQHHAENIAGENRALIDPRLGIYRFDGLMVLKNSSMPAVLLEAGLIVNRSEEVLLGDPVYRHAIAQTIDQAIERFCSGAIVADEALDTLVCE